MRSMTTTLRNIPLTAMPGCFVAISFAKMQLSKAVTGMVMVMEVVAVAVVEHLVITMALLVVITMTRRDRIINRGLHQCLMDAM